MGVLLATLRKELISYLYSPVAYIIIVVLYLFRGIEVSLLCQTAVSWGYDTGTFASFYTIMGRSSFLFLILVPPVLTMRCFAEEKRTGSLEVLMTAPVRDFEIVLGKWLAALGFYGLIWLPSLPILSLLSTGSFLDTELAYGPVFSAYVGLALIGGMLLAVGVFFSSLTDNVLLAAILGILFNVGLLAASQFLNSIAQEGAMADDFLVQTFIDQLNVFEHLSNWFGRGQIDTSKFAFYLGGTAFFLFMTTRSLESRKWR